MNIEQKVIDKALGPDGLPVKARAGKDPGEAYFNELLGDLKAIFESSKDNPQLSKALSHALYCLGHYPYVEYSNAQRHGRKFREDLFDPQIFQLEMAVESIFSGEWIPYMNES